jgi:putative endonuclease
MKKKPITHAKPSAPPKVWHLYVLRCGDGTLYCGITNDLERRLAQHVAGKAARYTRGRGPVVLVRAWPQEGKSASLRAEYAFKRLRRAVKEQRLIA